MIEMLLIEKVYNTGVTQVSALRGVDMKVAAGEMVAIMGPSGSGKSTLLNIIGCLDRPTNGTYLLAGNVIAETDDDRLAEVRNRYIGFVFQQFNLLPRLTAIQNVETPLIYRGTPAGERRRLALQALATVGLGDRWDHRPTQLSGGEQQRVAIARAMVVDPSVLLADEPTGALDTRTGEEIMALFQELHQNGKTVLIVTHNEWVARHCERIIRLQDGRVIAEERVQKPLVAGHYPADPAMEVDSL